VKLPESLKPGLAAPRRGWLSPAALTEAWRKPGLAPLLALGVLTTFAWSSLEATLARFGALALRFTQPEINAMFFILAFTLTFMQGMVVRRFGPRIGERRMLVAGTVLLAVGFATLPLASPWAALVAALVLIAVGIGFTNPAISSLVSRRAAAHEQGGTLGVLQSLASLCRVFGPIFGGKTIETWGPSAPGYAGAAILSVAAVVAIVFVEPAPGGTPVSPEASAM
jgi:DHA1 family tetracycline resistance protein-like MFS transporter